MLSKYEGAWTEAYALAFDITKGRYPIREQEFLTDEEISDHNLADIMIAVCQVSILLGQLIDLLEADRD